MVDTLLEAEAVIFHLEKNHYDLIISDYNMPRLNGLKLFQQLRQADNYIPFVLLSGSSREEVRSKALNLGVDHYLVKDMDSQSQYRELMHIIIDMVNQTEGYNGICS